MIGSSAGEDEFARRRDFWFIGELTFFLSSFVSLEPARTHSSWHRWYMRLEFGESLEKDSTFAPFIWSRAEEDVETRDVHLLLRD